MKKNLLKIIYNILASLSKIYFKRNKIYVIWITWSVWKTSCRMIVYQVLQKFLTWKKIYTSPKNFNSELWIIFSIFEIEKYNPWINSLLKIVLKIFYKSIFIKPNYEVLILEYWIDKPFDMDFLLKVVKPNLSIFTKLDAIHLSQFNSLDQIWQEKFKLLFNTKDKVYLNYLDEYCKKNFDSIKIEKKYYFWWDLIVKDYDFEKNSINKIFAKFENNDFFIKTNLLWEENANYIILALDIIKNLNWIISKKNIFLDLELQNGRFNIFSWIKNSILIDSSYNSWPESMKLMISNTFLLKEKLFQNYKIGFILWDMRELWIKTELEHKNLSNFVKKADLVWTIWENMKKYFIFDWNYKNYLSSKILWKDLRQFLEKTDQKYIFLFKWSQNTIFVEEALKQVLLYKNDEKNLVRQDEYWLENKNKYFDNFRQTFNI